MAAHLDLDPGADGFALTVYFDADCGLCRRVANWLERQPKFVPLHCVAAQSQPRRPSPSPSPSLTESDTAICPLDADALMERLTVTATDGAVYRSTKAWIMCLWALREYRGWSLTLSKESLWPWARRLYAAITGVANLTKPGRRRSKS